MSRRNLLHEQLVKDILLVIGSRHDVRIWPRHVGLGRNMHTGNVIKYGIDGESDIDGIVSPGGRRLHIEVKTGRAVQNKAQRRFQAMIEKFGGIYILARSVQDVIDRLEKEL